MRANDGLELMDIDILIYMYEAVKLWKAFELCVRFQFWLEYIVILFCGIPLLDYSMRLRNWGFNFV